MAERLSRIEMQAFRGVREKLVLEFPHGSSAVLLGENGTGKSTVADALEWYFTGEIDFLRHEGRANSFRHIDALPNVATSVSLETTGILGGNLELGNTLQEAVRAAGRETFLLRGRTLTAFVERTKGEKWKALTELLGLQQVDRLRLDLQKAKNEARDAADDASQEHDSVSRSLASKVNKVTDAGIFEALTELCSAADISAPTSLSESLSLEWTASLGGTNDTSKSVLLAALAGDLRAWSPIEFSGKALEHWNSALKSQSSMDRTRLRFFTAAETLLSEPDLAGSCPLCGQHINKEVLRSQVLSILDELRISAGELQQASDEVKHCAALMESCSTQLIEYRRKAADLGVTLPEPPMSPHTRLSSAIAKHQPVSAQIPTEFAGAVTTWLTTACNVAEAAVTPPPTARESTLVELGVLVGQARRWRDLGTKTEQARKAYEFAETTFQVYSAHQQDYFAQILNQISGRAAEIYGKLHPDEGLADVCIEPWGPKGVELAMTFHGSHQKPPHGVLSESHLNSLAVALFLAMADSFNDQLDFLILDDVVNSFDAAHRGELAAILATDFSHRQLIVLTHDQLFFDRLTRLAPSWKKIEFTSWDISGGPRTTTYQSAKMLQKAMSALADGDRPGAGMMGRRALEEILQDICEGLAAPLPFRRGIRNDRREIGEVLAGTRRVLKELSNKTYSEIKPLLDALDADVATALNPEAHASQAHPGTRQSRIHAD